MSTFEPQCTCTKPSLNAKHKPAHTILSKFPFLRRLRQQHKQQILRYYGAGFGLELEALSPTWTSSSETPTAILPAKLKLL